MKETIGLDGKVESKFFDRFQSDFDWTLLGSGIRYKGVEKWGIVGKFEDRLGKLEDLGPRCHQGLLWRKHVGEALFRSAVQFVVEVLFVWIIILRHILESVKAKLPLK